MIGWTPSEVSSSICNVATYTNSAVFKTRKFVQYQCCIKLRDSNIYVGEPRAHRPRLVRIEPSH